MRYSRLSGLVVVVLLGVVMLTGCPDWDDSGIETFFAEWGRISIAGDDGKILHHPITPRSNLTTANGLPNSDYRLLLTDY